jgi:hypothetical protein
MITDDEKAMVIQLAMDIDLGIINLKEALKVIRKDVKSWIPILEFMETSCELTRNALDRLYLESRYQRSFHIS